MLTDSQQVQEEAATDNNNKTSPTQQGAVTFTPEQQHVINRLVDKAASRMSRKHREELAKVQSERDAAATGSIGESDLVAKLRAERDAAQTRVKDMERAKSEAIAASAFTKAWKAHGLEDNDQWRSNMRAAFTRINDDGEVIVVDLQGRERYGVDLPTLMGELAGEFPKLRGTDGDSGAPRNPSGNNAQPKTKEDFGNDTRAKMDYISKFGLPAWEALPVSNETRNIGGATREAALARNWSQAQRDEYTKKHGFDALKERLRVERLEFPR